MAVSLTYGVMPGRKAFYRAFRRDLGEGRYRYTMRGRDGALFDVMKIQRSDSVSVDELYRIVFRLVRLYNKGPLPRRAHLAGTNSEIAGDIASSILSSLGFHWV